VNQADENTMTSCLMDRVARERRLGVPGKASDMSVLWSIRSGCMVPVLGYGRSGNKR
jgi:hypothetical protein